MSTSVEISDGVVFIEFEHCTDFLASLPWYYPAACCCAGGEHLFCCEAATELNQLLSRLCLFVKDECRELSDDDAGLHEQALNIMRVVEIIDLLASKMLDSEDGWPPLSEPALVKEVLDNFQTWREAVRRILEEKYIKGFSRFILFWRDRWDDLCPRLAKLCTAA